MYNIVMTIYNFIYQRQNKRLHIKFWAVRKKKKPNKQNHKHSKKVQQETMADTNKSCPFRHHPDVAPGWTKKIE